MKDWVRPYLIEQTEKFLEGKADKKRWLKMKIKSLESDEAVYYELIHELNTHFGIGGLGGPIEEFTHIFGSVLADLPKVIFLKLCNIRYVFYTFIPNPGAEVKHLLLEEEDFKDWDRIIVVQFPYETVFMPPAAIRGEIAHEFAHIVLHSDKAAGNVEMENEADEQVKKWGFENEIKALREWEKTD